MSDDEFGEIVDKTIQNIPEPYKSRLENVAFIVEDEPSQEQRHKLALRTDQTLLGLYEGTPLPQRAGRTKLLPDKITLFKLPILAASATRENVIEQVKQTVWHEVAHYFGLDHDRIHDLENK